MAETETTYQPPELLSEIDDDVIHARMLNALPNDIDRTEGGFAHDFTRPAAIEKADMMVLLNEIVQLFFPRWSYGVYLDELAGMAGLKRKAANPAIGVVRVTGERGTRIPQGFLFATASDGARVNILFEAVSETVIGADKTALVAVRALEGGAMGNVAAGAVALMVEPVAGVESVVNEEPTTGGSDEEDDTALRARIIERNSGIDASYAGSVADYVRWAKEVPGVGDAKALPLWDGPGTVKLIVVDEDGLPANDEIIKDVIENILSPGDERMRRAPIGAAVSIVSPEATAIAVSARVVLAGVAMEDVRSAFRAALGAYMAQAVRDGTVRVSRVGRILSEIDGVDDYADLRVNGQSANVILEADAYPALGEVTLNEE